MPVSILLGPRDISAITISNGGQDIVNDAVAELIKKMVTSPDFEKGIREKIAARVDTSELEQELDGLKKKMRQLEVSKDKIAIQMDNLDVTDSMYEKKYDDLQKRFYDKYDEMALTENHMDEIQSRLAHIRRKQLSGDRIYNFLIAFDKLYDKLSDAEKKEFMGTFVESIELYPERLENGKFLKHIHFRFPVYYNGTVIDDISWENESTVETVVLLSKGAKGPVDLCSARTEVERRMADSRKVKVDFSLEDMDLSEFKGKATYEQIKAYVLEKTGLKVSSLYIAQIKKKCGLDVGENFNPAKSENARQPQCTPEKEDAIMQAFRHFGII
jgi:site-specific DNA recombinase